jgi:hypothetical protein
MKSPDIINPAIHQAFDEGILSFGPILLMVFLEVRCSVNLMLC